jgi:hypothetical protein
MAVSKVGLLCRDGDEEGLSRVGDELGIALARVHVTGCQSLGQGGVHYQTFGGPINHTHAATPTNDGAHRLYIFSRAISLPHTLFLRVEVCRTQQQVASSTMLEYRTQGYNGYSVKYSPFFDSRIAVAASANFGLVGNGRVYILGLTPNGIVAEKWCAFFSIITCTIRANTA